MEFEKDLVLDETENMDETIEETEEVEEVEEPNEPEKLYTEEEFNARIDDIVSKRLARQERKLTKDFKDKLAKYEQLERVVNAGLGTSSIDEATENLSSYYAEQGVEIPSASHEYNDEDTKILAEYEAGKIKNLGLEEVDEELERLSQIGDMSTRDRLIFNDLLAYKKAEEGRHQLQELGVTDEVIESKEFKTFASRFKAETPMTEIYELFASTNRKPPAKIGSLKNGATEDVKQEYTPEEVDRLTEKDFDNPKVMEAVRRSMLRWK